MNAFDAMVRWQGYAREQRSTVNSLFLTFAAALLGLQSSIVLSKETLRISWACFFIVAATASALSLTGGCIVVLVRLRDARRTARIARLRVKDPDDPEIQTLQKSTDFLGKVTNGLIPIQVIAFGVSAVVFLIWVILSFGYKFGA